MGGQEGEGLESVLFSSTQSTEVGPGFFFSFAINFSQY
jgi:hypothetical protein